MRMTNELNLPQPFVDAVTRKYTYKPNRYSVTAILGGTCEAVLKRRHQDDVVVDVAQSVWAVFGSAVHKILEESKETDSQLKENWLSVQVGDYELSGIFDLYDADTKTVTDWKTAGTIKWLKKEFDDYRMQLLLYCWLLRKNGFEADNGEIVMLLKDWSKSKARHDSSYPQIQVQKVQYSFTDDDFGYAEKFVNGWFDKVREQERLNDSELTPCSPKSRWHKDDVWAVMKKGRKSAIRLYQDEESALQRVKSENEKASGNPFYIQFRQGEDTKCELYCSVAQWCPLMRR